METGNPPGKVPRLFVVLFCSSLANAKSEPESQSEGRSPKTRAVASPEKEKLVRQFFTYWLRLKTMFRLIKKDGVQLKQSTYE